MTPSTFGNTSSTRRLFGRRSLSTLAALVVLVGGGTLIWKPVTNALSQGAPADSAAAAAKESSVAPGRVIAYYFHTTYRCVSCRNIEKYTREALESGFSTDLEEGHLVWRVINVEEKGNEHFVKDYQLFTKSVVLVDERTGEWKNLPKVWQLLGDPNEFIRYIQTETGDFLQGQHS
jgi:hypothetical protein